MGKICSRCKIEKERTDFHKSSKKTDGLQVECKFCRSERHKQTYAGRTPAMEAWKIENVGACRAYVDYVKTGPCADCGNTFPTVCMDFDHLPGFDKVAGVAQLIKNGNLDRIKEEIMKCELVCANCHRIRTQDRYGSMAELGIGA